MELDYQAERWDSTRQQATADWSNAGDRAHVVQFYEDDEHLVELLARFIGKSLVAGDGAVVIATADHLKAVRECLKMRGLDIEVPRSQGRYFFFDAHETVERLCRGGLPDPERFSSIIGTTVASLTRNPRGGGTRVAAFGEMVALLWTAGRYHAALQLEELWNTLLRIHHVSLCCAYSMRTFDGQRHAAPFLRICAQHTHVFPARRRTT